MVRLWHDDTDELSATAEEMILGEMQLYGEEFRNIESDHPFQLMTGMLGAPHGPKLSMLSSGSPGNSKSLVGKFLLRVVSRATISLP